MTAVPLSAHGTRRAPRRAVELECIALADAWDEGLSLEVRDLSPYGMWVDIEYPLPLGEELIIHFRPPGAGVGGAGVVAHAMVVRTSLAPGEGGMALEFLELNRGAFETLSAALDGLPPRISRAAQLRRLNHLTVVERRDSYDEVLDDEFEAM